MLPIDLTLAAPNLPQEVAEHAAAAAVCQKAKVLLVADMSARNTEARLWAFDLSDPKKPVLVLRTQVAHGAGSADPKHPGFASRFSNVPDSGMTSLGPYRIGQTYVGDHGKSYRLEGLMQGWNTKAYERDVMLHPSNFVGPGRVANSLGCLAVANDVIPKLDKHFRSLTGAAVWVDGPGVPTPKCDDSERTKDPFELPPEWAVALNTNTNACEAHV